MESRRSARTWIHEPMTALTDLILTAMAVYFALGTGRQHDLTGMRVHLYFSWAFWALGAGALLGALTHGIGRHLSVALGRLIWRSALLSVGAGAFFLLLATACHALPARSVHFVEWPGVFLLALYAIIVLRDDRFLWAAVFYTAAMLVVLVLLLRDLFLFEDVAGPGLVVSGILVSFAAAIVQRSGLDLHRHFNHNDLYHVVQMVGLYYLYRGALLLKDWPGG